MGADPTIIRHVDDLAALKVGAATSSEFVGLARKAGADDLSRGGEAAAPWRILLNGFLAMDAALHQGSGGAR